MSQHAAQLCRFSREIVKARFAVDSPPVLHLKVQQLKADLACDSGTVDETDASPLSSRPKDSASKTSNVPVSPALDRITTGAEPLS